MQEGPGTATLTTKQLASSVTVERTNQEQGVKKDAATFVSSELYYYTEIKQC